MPTRRLTELVDIESVPLHGNPRDAVISTPDAVTETLCTDILICGGGLGGVAAALAAAKSGARIILLEESSWVGGQATSQGVSALDEHAWIEDFGGTRHYEQFRSAIREHYLPDLKSSCSDEEEKPPNPGKCWVSTLAFEPKVALQVLEEMLEPLCADGRLRIFRRTKVYGCERTGDRLEALDVMNLESGKGTRIAAKYIIDATEMGDLLPLTGLPFRIGAESRRETGEPHAPELGSPSCVQGCTYPFVLEKIQRDPTTETAPRAAPEGYARFRDQQPYSLRINIHGKADTWLQYAMFDRLPGTRGSVWDYRRIIAGQQFRKARNDLSMMNWPGNDYFARSLLDLDGVDLAAALQEAKQLSRGLAHWFLSEISAPNGQSLRLVGDVLGSSDGLSKFPYIREARRIIPLKTIVEQDVHADQHPGVRSRSHDDTVGIGHYALDVHDTCDGAAGFFVATKPFQIPLGAFIPAVLENYIAGAKNIGVTHITNGCYRLHPVEWNVGEVAGHLAAFAWEQDRTPSQIYSDKALLRQFQYRCLSNGIPCSWLNDVPSTHPGFFSVQALVLLGGPPSEEELTFHPEERVGPGLADRWTRAVQAEYPDFVPPAPFGSREAFARELGRHLSQYL